MSLFKKIVPDHLTGPRSNTSSNWLRSLLDRQTLLKLTKATRQLSWKALNGKYPKAIKACKWWWRIPAGRRCQFEAWVQATSSKFDSLECFFGNSKGSICCLGSLARNYTVTLYGERDSDSVESFRPGMGYYQRQRITPERRKYDPKRKKHCAFFFLFWIRRYLSCSLLYAGELAAGLEPYCLRRQCFSTLSSSSYKSMSLFSHHLRPQTREIRWSMDLITPQTNLCCPWLPKRLDQSVSIYTTHTGRYTTPSFRILWEW